MLLTAGGGVGEAKIGGHGRVLRCVITSIIGSNNAPVNPLLFPAFDSMIVPRMRRLA